MNGSHTLPAPSHSIRLERCVGDDGAPDEHATETLARQLPAKPGVLILENAAGSTIAMLATANLRRACMQKLGAPAADAVGTRPTIDLRSITHTLTAFQVGSAFEADWAYLQLARQRWPATYRELLDHWQSWFLHGDADAAFPQLVKTAHPDRNASPFQRGEFIGPFADKHAAGRYMELLQDAFDLCRYHHILVQAPRGVACVYKEMGRCAAPCDGSASMSDYRITVREALTFACSPKRAWQTKTEQAMHDSSASLHFEQAEKLRVLLDRTAPLRKPEFAFVNRLERFCFAAVHQGLTPSAARVFMIRGGWVEPLMDLPLKADDAQATAAIERLRTAAQKSDHLDFGPAAMENIGVVCWHLFRNRSAKAKRSGTFIPIDELDLQTFKAALKRLAKRASEEGDSSTNIDADIMPRDKERFASP